MPEQISTHNQNMNSNDQIDLYELFCVLLDNKWKILIITAVFTLVSTVYALLATPIYSASALIQVEQNTASNALLSTLSDMIPGNKPESQTEMNLLKSGMVLGETVDQLALDTFVREKHFPVVGKGLARLLGQPDGKIAISRLTVPDELLDTPFTLKVLSSDQYSITINSLTLQGKTGVLLSEENINLLVSGIDAPTDTIFVVTKLEKLTAINNLRVGLTVSELSKDSGMLQLIFKGESARQAAQILNSVSNVYLQQNVGRKSEEVAKSLAFLKAQLPQVRAKLDDAENRLNQYRQKNVSVDLSLEAKSALNNIVDLETQINELSLKEAELSKLYTREHPVYRTLLEKKALLLKERDKLNVHIGNMPKTQQEILNLTRDVESGQEVYMLLFKKQQELNINKAGAIGNVRIIDSAVVEKRPIDSKSPLIIALGTMLGLFISSLFYLQRKFLHNGIDSSEQIESLELNVYASIPESRWLKDKNMKLMRNKRRTVRSINLLAKDNPSDLSVEAIRSLRTSLYFAMRPADNNILLISGATPEAGKTFISCNLATVIAQSDKKVLLIDADLRKGLVHHVIGCPENNGLSEILIGAKGFDDVIKKTEIENMDFISRGKIPTNPAELLMNDKFQELMKWASDRYDLVIMDTPPVLAVSDACIVSKYAGAIIIVVDMETNNIKEVKSTVKLLHTSNTTPFGVVLNKVRNMKRYYY
jgi:tyrosine-protein kinase Etk/Wzc